LGFVPRGFVQRSVVLATRHSPAHSLWNEGGSDRFRLVGNSPRTVVKFSRSLGKAGPSSAVCMGALS
jgi:hypothetical protein